MQYSQKLFTSREFKQYQDPFGFAPNYKASVYLLVEASMGGFVLGRAIAGVYPTTSIERTNQWQFGENRRRSLWIDRIDVRHDHQGKSIGEELMRRTELYLGALALPEDPNITKRNMYLVALREAIPFYLKCGWDIIFTGDDDEEDEDYPDVFHAEHAVWMAKPLGDSLDREEKYFDLLADEEIIDEMISDHVPGVDQLEDQIYEAYVTVSPEGHPLCILSSLFWHGSLKEVKGLYDRLKTAMIKVNYLEEEKYPPTMDFHPRILEINPEGTLILKWAEETFGDHVHIREW